MGLTPSCGSHQSPEALQVIVSPIGRYRCPPERYRSHERGAVAVTSGDITGPRQASRAGSTVSHDLMSGWNARLQ